jgi:hypothetical protein
MDWKRIQAYPVMSDDIFLEVRLSTTGGSTGNPEATSSWAAPKAVQQKVLVFFLFSI